MERGENEGRSRRDATGVGGPSALSVRRIDAANGAVAFHITGELDLVTAPVLSRALEDCGSARLVVINLVAVRLLDARGISAILQTSAILRDRGTVLVIAGAPPLFDKVFRLVDAEKVVPLFDTESEAVSSG